MIRTFIVKQRSWPGWLKWLYKILYLGSWGPYTILWVTDRSINCHLARNAMNYLLYYTCKSVKRHDFVIVYLRQKTSSDKIRKKTLYWSGPVNIIQLLTFNEVYSWLCGPGEWFIDRGQRPRLINHWPLKILNFKKKIIIIYKFFEIL